jgi:hypothetical protein
VKVIRGGIDPGRVVQPHRLHLNRFPGNRCEYVPGEYWLVGSRDIGEKALTWGSHIAWDRRDFGKAHFGVAFRRMARLDALCGLDA